MSRKFVFISSFIVGIIMLGAGLYLYLDYANKVRIPRENPIVTMRVVFPLAGEAHTIQIYSEGTIVYSSESGWKLPSSKPIRIWKKGNVSQGELSELLSYIENSGFNELNESYSYQLGPTGTARKGPAIITIYANINGVEKAVTAQGFLLKDFENSFVDLPDPLNNIYQRLLLIAETKTKGI